MDIVAVGRGPLEAVAEEHLSGVGVLGFYPAHLVGGAQVVGHQRSQQGDQVGIVHHPLQGLLEFFPLHAFQRDTRVGKAIQDIGKVRVVDVIGMEYGAILGRRGQQHDGVGYIVNRRELEGLAECIVGHHTNDDIGPEQCQEVVGVEVNLELAVLLTGRQIAHTHNLGIEAVVVDGIEHQFLGLELGVDVLVSVDVLAEPQILLSEFDVGTGDAVDTQTCNAGRGDVDETRTGAQAEVDELAHTLDVDQFDVVACREVFHVGHAVDHGEALTVETVEGARLGHLGSKRGDTLVETAKGVGLAEVIEVHGFETSHRVLAALDAQRAIDVAVVGREQLVEDVHTQITRGAR